MKKNIFITILLMIFISALSVTVVNADNYYISNSGNDNNLGTSETEPWATLSKVNDFSFKPGDVVYFNSGDVWRGTIIPHGGKDGQYITYTSYGSGDKPVFLGSVDKSKSSDWENKSGNIWLTKMNLKSQGIPDVGNIIFNADEAVGVKVFYEMDLKKQNDFFYNAKNDVLEMYSEGNPALKYNKLECALMKSIVDLDQRSYVVIDGISLKYGGGCGINGDEVHYIKILNCDISYIGGGLLYWDDGTPIRFGNGINFWNNANDIQVEKCNIWEIYDTAVSNQGNGEDNKQYNIAYRNNNIWNIQWAFEIWHKDTNTIVHDIYFENNVSKNSGYAWGSNQRPDGGGGYHLTLFASSARMTNIYIRDNLFENAKSANIYLSAQWKGIENLTLDKNVYVQDKDKCFAWYSDEKYYSDDFNTYKIVSGKDANSELHYNSSIVSLNNN